jgi:hypothetical protein
MALPGCQQQCDRFLCVFCDSNLTQLQQEERDRTHSSKRAIAFFTQQKSAPLAEDAFYFVETFGWNVFTELIISH